MKPILKLYRGYANDQELIVMGTFSNRPRQKTMLSRKKKFQNATSIIRLFRLKTHANADVYLEHNNTTIHTKTLVDGYFKFCVPVDPKSGHGWIDYEVSIFQDDKKIVTRESFIRPKKENLGIISDIDDTFLVSYTENTLKKLYHLLFRDVNSRKVFKDVVPHYQALSQSGRTSSGEQNAFFLCFQQRMEFVSFFGEIHRNPPIAQSRFVVERHQIQPCRFFMDRERRPQPQIRKN